MLIFFYGDELTTSAYWHNLPLSTVLKHTAASEAEKNAYVPGPVRII